MEIAIESLLILSFFASLLILGWATDSHFLLSPFGASRFTYLTTLALALIFAVLLFRRKFDRATEFMGRWWQVVGALIVYESLKLLHANRITEWLGIQPLDWVMLRADQALFAKALPLRLEWLAVPWFTQVMWLFYAFVYYLEPVALLGWAFFIQEDEILFSRLRRVLVIGLLGGYLLYLVFPVAGPLFYIGEQFKHPILTQLKVQRLTFSTLRYNWDCFPSLHTAIPWLLVFTAWSRLSKPGRGLVVLAASGVTLSTVVLRFHYGIDLVAGLAWAGLVFCFAVWRPLIPASIRLSWLPRITFSTTSLRMRLRLLGALSLTTGCAGLLAGQVFEKLLGNLLGTAAPARIIVLATYLFGMALGAALFTPVAKRHRDPLLVYALVEAGAALWILLLFAGFEYYSVPFAPFLRMAYGHVFLLPAVRFLVASVWIFPSALLMGAGFPALAASLGVMRVPSFDRAMTRFCTLTIAGAAFGSILGPYFCFRLWGIDGTSAFVAMLCGLACLIALRLRRIGGAGRPIAPEALSIPRIAGISRQGWSLVAIAVLLGYSLFSLDVVWVHLISIVSGTSAYALAAQLGLMFLGLLAGGAGAALILPRRRMVAAWFPGAAFLMLSAVIYVGSQRWDGVPGSFSVWGGGLSTFEQGEILRWILTALQILPPAVVLGTVFPMLLRLPGFQGQGRAGFTGLLGAAGALGGVAGVLVTGLGLMPSVGSEATLTSLGILFAFAGFLILFGKGNRWQRPLAGSACVILAIGWLLSPAWNRLHLTSGDQARFRPTMVGPSSRLDFFQEDALGSITTIVTNPGDGYGAKEARSALLVNGVVQGDEAEEAGTQVGCALIPLLHNRNFRNACILGLGTGRGGAVVHAMGFEHLDVVEAIPGVVAAARGSYSGPNQNLLAQPNVELHLEDGRNYLFLSPLRRYDLITLEAASPWSPGGAPLYAREFYKLVKDRLNQGGVFQQRVPLQQIGRFDIGSVLITLRTVFPRAEFWVHGGQGMLIASDSTLALQPEAFRRIAAFREKGSTVPASQTCEYLAALLESRLLGEEDVNRFLTTVHLEVNTDGNRRLEFSVPRDALNPDVRGAQNLKDLAMFAQATQFVVGPGTAPSLLTETLARTVPRKTW